MRQTKRQKDMRLFWDEVLKKRESLEIEYKANVRFSPQSGY